MSFSYEVNSRREVPVNAEIYRVRTDLSWEDILLDFFKELKSLNGMGTSLRGREDEGAEGRAGG